MGFADYSVIVDEVRPIVGSGGQEFTLIYDGYLREIEFSDPLAELAQIYEQERARCGKRYVQKKRRHYAPTFGGNRRLGLEVRQISGYVAARGPHEVIDSHRGILRSGFM